MPWGGRLLFIDMREGGGPLLLEGGKLLKPPCESRKKHSEGTSVTKWSFHKSIIHKKYADHLLTEIKNVQFQQLGCNRTNIF